MKVNLEDSQVFLGGVSGKESACQCRRFKRCGFDPLLDKSPWSRNGTPLQYSCLENSWAEETGGQQSMGLQSRT